VSDVDCDDGVFCNGAERCSSACAETCTAGAPATCPTGEVCDEGSDRCVATPACDAPFLWFRDADGDGSGDPNDAQWACTMPVGRVRNYGDCDDDDTSRSPSASEVCDDTTDEDCDGAVDEGCDCTSGTHRPCGIEPGCIGQQDCIAGAWDRCAALSPSLEICNGLDDDCDGVADESPGPLSCGPTVACETGRCAERTVRGLAAQDGQSFAYFSDGTVRVWGSGPIFPERLTNLSAVIDMRADDDRVCALQSGGRITCFRGRPTGAAIFNAIDAAGAVVMDVGSTSGCFVRGDGHVLCWGEASYGQLGPGASGGLEVLVPVEIPGITNAIEVASSNSTNCALLADGSVMCWGSGIWGTLGNGMTSMSASPVVVTGIDDAIHIAAGRAHLCVERPSGMWCWGYNEDSALGDGTVTPRSRPVAAMGLPAGTRLPIRFANSTSCYISPTRTVLCLGLGSLGQLGDGRGVSSSTPVEVSGLTNVRTLMGGGAHYCASTDAGEVYCWGYATALELGDGGTMQANEPVRVSMIP